MGKNIDNDLDYESFCNLKPSQIMKNFENFSKDFQDAVWEEIIETDLIHYYFLYTYNNQKRRINPEACFKICVSHYNLGL